MSEQNEFQPIPGETFGAAIAAQEKARQEKINQLRGNKNNDTPAPQKEPRQDHSLKTLLESHGVDRLRDLQTGEWTESFEDALKRWDKEQNGQIENSTIQERAQETASALLNLPEPQWLKDVHKVIPNSSLKDQPKTVPLAPVTTTEARKPIPDLFSDKNWDK